MNPVLRHRIPTSVRKLLTDIGPREVLEEPESIFRDGVELPSRGTNITDQSLFTNDEDDSITTTKSRLCGLCLSKLSCYTCPRCNIPYCGLVCYRSSDHSACSEEFYKESVLQELKSIGKTESDSRKKMQDILLQLRHEAEGTDRGMESVFGEVQNGSGAGIYNDDEVVGADRLQIFELLSRLAEIQSSGNGSEEEIEDILIKLKEIGGEHEHWKQLAGADGDVEVEGDDELDLVDKLSGLDVNALSEEALWDLLSSQEKEKFKCLIKDGNVGGLVPLWKPWWALHEDRNKVLVEVLEEEMNTSLREEGGSIVGQTKNTESQTNTQDDNQEVTKNTTKSVTEQRECKGTDRNGPRKDTQITYSRVPKVNTKIPTLSSLSTNPSRLVCYGLVNALFGYTFSLCLFNGDIETDQNQEFCQLVMAVSEALNSGKVFNSLLEALKCGEAAILARGYLDREDPYAPARAVEAVAHIMTGRSKQDVVGYCQAALSQLRTLLTQARAAIPREGHDKETRRKYFLAGKKCEFFQAWVADSKHEVQRMAMELWKEHSKREEERNTLEKDKTVTEEIRKKEGKKEKGVLIKEIS
ncbi:zinc finger HIT domain-containing protein 2 [Aplochiton taeniatus]